MPGIENRPAGSGTGEAATLVVDAARGEANGVALNADAAELRAFGETPDDHGRGDQRRYPGLGFEAALEDGRILVISAIFRADDEITDLHRLDGFRPCRVDLLLPDGERLPLSPETRQTDLEQSLGALSPQEGGERPMHTVEVGNTQIALVFDERGRLALADIAARTQTAPEAGRLVPRGVLVLLGLGLFLLLATRAGPAVTDGNWTLALVILAPAGAVLLFAASSERKSVQAPGVLLLVLSALGLAWMMM